MYNPRKGTFQRKRTKSRNIIIQKRANSPQILFFKVCPLGRYQGDEDFTVFLAFTNKQMTQVTCVLCFMKVRNIALFEEIQRIGKNLSIIFIHDAAVRYRYDIVHAAPFMKAQRKRPAQIFVSEGIFHLIAISFDYGTCIDSLIDGIKGYSAGLKNGR